MTVDQADHAMRLLRAGRTADVFELGRDWVLRRTRDGTSADPERSVMTYLRDQGFPVPRQGPRGADTPPGDLVLERLHGPTMADALTTGSLSLDEGAQTLASLLRRLHEIPGQTLTGGESRILHLDLHPENVILTEKGPMVIDWTNSAEGPPALDRAMSALILAQVSLTALPPAASEIREFLALFVRAIARDGGIPSSDLRHAVELRSQDPNLSQAEVAQTRIAADMVGAAMSAIPRPTDDSHD